MTEVYCMYVWKGQNDTDLKITRKIKDKKEGMGEEG
jgi:hypothetical protein